MLFWWSWSVPRKSDKKRCAVSCLLCWLVVVVSATRIRQIPLYSLEDYLRCVFVTYAESTEKTQERSLLTVSVPWVTLSLTATY